MNTGYEGKVALVTGGSAGIGRATVEGLLREGAKVAFCSRNAETGMAAEAQMKALGDVMYVQADLTDEAAVEAYIAKVVERWGRLDVAMNVVGLCVADDPLGPRLHEVLTSGFVGTVEKNLTIPFLCMKHEIPLMLKQGGGAIVNCASIGGVNIIHTIATAAYSAAKAGVVQLTRFAAAQYAMDNIRVNSVSPGTTATEGVLAYGEEVLKGAAQLTNPSGIIKTPQEVANAFVWLGSDAASGVTGVNVVVA